MYKLLLKKKAKIVKALKYGIYKLKVIDITPTLMVL